MANNTVMGNNMRDGMAMRNQDNKGKSEKEDHKTTNIISNTLDAFNSQTQSTTFSRNNELTDQKTKTSFRYLASHIYSGLLSSLLPYKVSDLLAFWLFPFLLNVL